MNAAGLMTEDARELREGLILEHLPQVRLIARRIHERLPESVSLDDLVSSGILGLIAAIDNFDPAHNVKLKTYAEYKIRGAILDSLRKLDWASRDRRRKTKQIEAATLSIEQRLHRAAGEEEIAVELHLDLREYREWQLDILGLNLNSLDYSYDREDGRNLIDTVADKEEHWPSNLVESRELERVLAAGMERMPEVERIVLHRYYQEDLTLREIAQGMHLNLSRISQLKSQAILRLRSFLGKRWPIQNGGRTTGKH